MPSASPQPESSATVSDNDRQYGMARGQVFPAGEAKSLLNPLRRLVQSPRRTVGVMGLADDAVVLELGPGPGFFTPSIADAAPSGLVVLADIQYDMVAIAKQRMTGRANVAAVQADAASLPFRPRAIDAALVATMLGEVPDRGGCIGEIASALRIGAIVTIAETRRDSDFISFAALRALVERYGLRFIDRHGIAWQYVARFRVAG
jgi:ubiquinone/menaquinone biosynthesis C-methylase UbiE